MAALDQVDMNINGVIGFSGDITNGLSYTPYVCEIEPFSLEADINFEINRCGGYIVYPLGSVIVLKNIQSNKQTFLEGHSSHVSCIAVSKDGRTLASGQKNKVTRHTAMTLLISSHSWCFQSQNVTPAHVLVWDLDAAKKNCDGKKGGKMLVSFSCI